MSKYNLEDFKKWLKDSEKYDDEVEEFLPLIEFFPESKELNSSNFKGDKLVEPLFFISNNTDEEIGEEEFSVFIKIGTTRGECRKIASIVVPLVREWIMEEREQKKKKTMPKNYKNAQEHLNNLYTFKNKEEIKSINLENQELKGPLNFSEFPNLELISLKNNQISEVDVSNCRKLKHLDLTQNNNLTKLTIYELNFFERLIADTGTLKKSSIFGGEIQWEPQNVGNSNVAPLKIIETKPKSQKNPNENLISCLAQYQGSAPSDGYYLFISQDSKYTFEISVNHPCFIQNEPKKTWVQGNNIRFYKISWLASEEEKKLFTPEDLIEVVEQETKKVKKEKLTELEEPKWYQKPINYFWGVVIIVGVLIFLFLIKKILGIFSKIH